MGGAGRRDTLYGYLAEDLEEVFQDEYFAAVHCPDNGRILVPQVCGEPVVAVKTTSLLG